MAFTRVKPSGWAFGERLTSAQMNSLDIDHSNSLDKTGDTIGSSAVVTWAGTNLPFLASRTITRVQHLLPLKDDNATAENWSFILTPFRWRNTGTTVGTIYLWLDNLIDAGTLTAVHVRIKGPSGHGAFPGGAPQFMPTVRVWRGDPTLGTETALGSVATDSSASAGVYEAVHDVSVTGLTEVISETDTKHYYISITSEGGTNVILGTEIHGVRTAQTVTQLTPGG